MSLLVVGLYFLPYVLKADTVSSLLVIDEISLGLAVITLILAIAFYLWIPKRHINIMAFAVYLLLVVTTASLILSTGETSSPFIALWIAVAVFAGVFGAKGFLLLLGGVGAYAVYGALNDATTAALIIAGVAGLMPLVASYIIWHTKTQKDNQRDRAYTELATELSHEANKSDIVLNAINDGVIAVDKQGVIQLINPAAQAIIGWGKNDALNLSYKSVIKLHDKADKELTAINDPVEQVLRTNQQVHSEDFSITTESGKKVLLSLVVSPIGQPSTGAIMVFRDMTKEKSEEREQAEFISTASHEMRTPVASIEGYLGLALNPATAQIDDKAREYIGKAQASAKHLGRLFQDLLDVSKAEDGRMANNPKVVDVTEFVGDVVEGLRPKAEEKQLRMLFKPRPEGEEHDRFMAPVFYANVDNDHLREIVANLTENAIKYTLKGDVIIDIKGDEKTVTISIQDSGIGIPPEDIPHLFQKFYRVDSTDTREIGGTGLGLYLCRRLAELMNGKVSVKSVYQQGSTFYLEIPRIDHEDAMRMLEEASLEEEQRKEGPPLINPPRVQLPTAKPQLPQPTPIPTTSTQTSSNPPVIPPSQTVNTVQPNSVNPTLQPQNQATLAQQPPPRANTPLNQIEGNPSAYRRNLPGLNVSPRTDSRPNQP